MIPTSMGAGANDPAKKLQALYDKLPPAEQKTLLDFAEFLAGRCQQSLAPVDITPRNIPRPESESVVGAIKRLSESYHMVDRSKMLHETSGLMAQHVMQGRDAVEVIDELELLFERYYQRQFGEGSGEA